MVAYGPLNLQVMMIHTRGYPILSHESIVRTLVADWLHFDVNRTDKSDGAVLK